MRDLIWLIGILVFLFILWVVMGGPQRAMQQNETILINGPINNAPVKQTTPTNNSSDIKVTPVQ